jgi:molecular chaperone DnaK (HSP70)
MNLGIDIGTTNTILAYTDQYGDVKVWNFEHINSNALPSIVCIDRNTIFVGNTAKLNVKSNPSAVLHSNFKIHCGTNQSIFIDDNGVHWNGDGMMNIILSFIMYVVKDKLGISVIKNLTITVPIHFNDIQRKFTNYIAELPNVKKVNIIDEPIAAAYYYIEQGLIKENEVVLIYDFGGGTFDSTLLTSNHKKMDILSKFGDNKLGGRNIDKLLLSYFSDELESKLGPFDSWNNFVLQEINQCITQLKETINNSSNDIIEYIGIVKDAPMSFAIARNTFKLLIEEVINQTLEIVNKCIENAYIKPGSIDKIILTGGSSYIESIPKALMNRFGIAIDNILYQNMTEAVAIGACLFSVKDGIDNKVSEVPSEYSSVSHFNLGILTLHPTTNEPTVDLLVAKNSKLPYKAFQKYFATSYQQSKLTIYLVQYMDAKTDYKIIGQVDLVISNTLREKYEIQLSIEYRNDGMITCSVFDSQTGETKDIKIERLGKDDSNLILQREAINKYQLIG